MTTTVEMRALNSANVKMDNSSDTSRKYDISANVIITNSAIDRIMNGEVKSKEMKVICQFQCEGNDYYTTLSFAGVAGAERVTICTEINAFIDASKELVKAQKVLLP